MYFKGQLAGCRYALPVGMQSLLLVLSEFHCLNFPVEYLDFLNADS